MIDAAKPTVIVAFEHHDQIRPDAPIGDLFTKSLRYGAEILADHHAAMRDAFLRCCRQQCFEWHLHIGAVIGGKSMWHEIEPLQAEHVIEPDRTGMAHRCPKHFAKRLEGFDLKTRSIEPGEAPILAGSIQR